MMAIDVLSSPILPFAFSFLEVGFRFSPRLSLCRLVLGLAFLALFFLVFRFLQLIFR